ncbi:MAG: alpha/beta fold hydrolase [Promethearchaeota archaeon]
MSKEIKAEWLATYHEGDSRIRDKRHGVLRLNTEKRRIEFAVQTAESSPIIIVNYPIEQLRDVIIIDKRQKMKKRLFLQIELGEPPHEMTPLFSFSLADIKAVKTEILEFKKEVQAIQISDDEHSETDVIQTFAQLLMTPIEQFQQFLGDITSRLRLLSSKPREVTKTVLSPLEPKYPYQIQKTEINGRKVSFYSTSYSHPTVLLFLSPIGGKIEDFYPLISSLLGKYQLFIVGVRGFIQPIEQDAMFTLKDYVQDLKDFLEYLGSEKEIVLAAHSLFSAIILEEFLNSKYSNIRKYILISGAHRAPDNFRNGVKLLPPTQIWGSFRGQVKKLAPKILYSKDTERSIIDPFIQHAFSIPDQVYYEIFKDFLPRDYTKKIQSLSKPLLVIWGNKDQFIPRNLKEEMIKCAPSDLFTHKEISGSHMAILEESNVVAREINKFMDQKWSQIKIE